MILTNTEESNDFGIPVIDDFNPGSRLSEENVSATEERLNVQFVLGDS
jgi:hypothetical protein